MLLRPQISHAASINIPNTPQQISENEEIEFDAEIEVSAADNTPYFLRAVFAKKGTSNYCGYTWNGSEFYKGPISQGGHLNFFRIEISENRWVGKLRTKFDSTDSGCVQSGEYILKVQRYRETGSGAFDDQNEIMIIVNVTPPTPTPTPTPQPTSTPKVTKPTKNPNTTKTSNQSEKSISQYINNPTMTIEESSEYTKSVLGKTDSSNNKHAYPTTPEKRTSTKAAIMHSDPQKNQIDTEKKEKNEISTKKTVPIPAIVGASLLSLSAGIYMVKEYRKKDDYVE